MGEGWREGEREGEGKGDQGWGELSSETVPWLILTEFLNTYINGLKW